jgi:hypothetical protein
MPVPILPAVVSLGEVASVASTVAGLVASVLAIVRFQGVIINMVMSAGRKISKRRHKS